MEEVLIDLHLKKNIHTSNGIEVLELKLSIPKFGFVTFFGKTGVGKTTLLRMIAGLTKPDSGYIKVNNEYWFDSAKKINVKPQKRNIGFVFQDYALFPNMTVKEHLLYAQYTNEKTYVSDLLDVFQLKGLCNRKPAKLSGGQQQRLAVARALARKPQILLLDEPLSALDSEIRETLQHEILDAHHKYSATTVLVTHDLNEVYKLSDYVYVIDDGKVCKHGRPDDVFSNYSNNSNIQFEAKILRIDNRTLTIETNNTITTIEVSDSEARNLKVNDKILITAKSANLTIKNIS